MAPHAALQRTSVGSERFVGRHELPPAHRRQLPVFATPSVCCRITISLPVVGTRQVEETVAMAVGNNNEIEKVTALRAKAQAKAGVGA